MPVLKIWSTNKNLSLDNLKIDKDRLYYDTETKQLLIGTGDGNWELVSTGGGTGGFGYTGSRGYTGSAGAPSPIIYDAGTPYTDFSVGFNINCGGVT